VRPKHVLNFKQNGLAASRHLETRIKQRFLNQKRLLEPIGSTPPAEFEALYERSQKKYLKAACLKPTSLRKTRGGSFRSDPNI
jgi:hypothetical protein